VFPLAPAAALLLAADVAAQQQVFDYETNAFCDVSALSLNGDASAAKCVLAVTDGGVNTLSSVWTLDTLALGPQSVIRTHIALEIREGGSQPGSGMTFAFFAGGANAIGFGGGGLGFESLSPSVAIELDTYETVSFSDTSGNHVGVDVNGSLTSIDAVDPVFPLSGPLWVWIEYRQLDENLEVWVSADAVQPAAPLLSTPIDLLGVVGPVTRVGFTAANTDMGFRDGHLVHSWLLEIDDDSDGDGVMDFEDQCEGDDLAGDTDLDLLCDDLDPCPVDALDDQDGDGVCDVDDPCPLDPRDDSDEDEVCDGEDVCPGEDDRVDDDGDGVPDCLQPDEAAPSGTGGGPGTDRAPGSLRVATPVAGCGCGGGRSGWWWAGLLALAAARSAFRTRIPRDTPAG
jgi:hypothetical protein